MRYQNPRALSGKRGEKDMSQINLHGNHLVTGINEHTKCVAVTIRSNDFNTVMFFDDREALSEFIDQFLLHTHKLEAQNAATNEQQTESGLGADTTEE
jgi:hypothetical protein